MRKSAWLLLLHQIPPKPPYFRAQVLRRLTHAGALPIKNSAYLLPDSDETLEDFQWIYGEIVQQGGSAWLFRVDMIAGMAEDEIRESFQEARSTDYAALLEEATSLLDKAQEEAGSVLQSAAAKLLLRIQEIRRIDFFHAPGYTQLEETMNRLEGQLKRSKSASQAVIPAECEGHTWVTRKGVKVDRMASVWLISQFIDRQSQFRFVDPAAYTYQEGELRFDMFEGEFTHRGGLCTFEVLLAWRNLDNAGLRAIGEIVHDIDLKEERYERPETAGVRRMIEGICARSSSDEARLEMGRALFDTLYASFRQGAEPRL